MVSRQSETSDITELVHRARYALSKKMTKPVLTITGGFELKAGEKVLFVVDNKVDPLVIEAFCTAIKELGARVDLIVHDKGGLFTEWNAYDEISMDPERPYCWSSPHWVLDVAKDYDLVIDGTIGPKFPIRGRHQYYRWYTREQLESPALTFPDEVWSLIDVKTQEMVKKVKRVRLTEPEGTDLTFTFFNEYWEKATVPPYEKTPYMPGHILAFPFIPIPQSDMEGTIAATANHVGVYPRIEITIEDGKITRIDGGGKYGELWRDRLEKMKDVEYPGRLPGPGVGWVTGIPIGTHPKISRVRTGLFSRTTLMIEAARAGVVHIDFGPHAHVDKPETLLQYAREGRTLRHIHVQLYFVTYEAETEDGQKIKIIDNGHLTALDDPQVREIAAKYGDPDEVLKVDWVPAVPGISIPGDYQEYAKDPLLWIKNTPIFKGVISG